MAVLYDQDIEKQYIKIVEYVNEYSVEDDIDITIDLEEVKHEIIELLETHHRPIKLCDYEYGFSTDLKKDHLLIVKESGDKSKVREYSKDINGEWQCCNYNSISIKCESLCLKFKYGILFVPIWHTIGCEALELLLVKQTQDLLTQRDAMEAQTRLENRNIFLSLNESILSTIEFTDNSSEHENIYNEILEHVSEYVTRDPNDFLRVAKKAKQRIIEILKTHRPIKLHDYEYGLSRAFKENHRIIVKEENDKSKVREYFKDTPTSFRCSSRNVKIRCRAKYLFFKYGILFAPILHVAGCKPRDLLKVMQVQDMLKKGDSIEAQRIFKSRNLPQKEFALSSTDESNDKSITYSIKHENIYKEILEHVTEYALKNQIDIFFNAKFSKHEIIDLLKTHRPIKLCDYEYGLSMNLKKDHRIIIKEADDKLKVREYAIDLRAYWRCHYHKHKCRAMRLIFKYGILFAPILHFAGCKPRDLLKVMQFQELLKQGKSGEAHGFHRRIRNGAISRKLLKLNSLTKECKEIDVITSESEDDINSPFDSNEIEKLYTELLEHVKEYSAENDFDVAYHLQNAKPEITELLKTHRPVRRCDLKYELSQTLKNHYRYVIREIDDRSKAREYCKVRDEWLCRSWSSKKHRCKAMLEFKYGLTFASNVHCDGCLTIDYTGVLQVQELSEKGKVYKGPGISTKENRNSSNQTLSLLSINTRPANECSISVQENEINFHNPVTSSTPALSPYLCELSKMYEEILEHINEYTVENNIAFTNYWVKNKIFQLLETHRPIKLDDYEYGFSKILKKDHRMIIKEANDKSKVREYCKTESHWRCLNYNSKNRCATLALKFFLGILFAPISHKCDTKEISFVMQVQDLLKQGKSKEARVLLKRQSERKRALLAGTNHSELMELQSMRKRKLPTAVQNNYTISSKKLAVLHPLPNENSHDSPMQIPLPFTPTEQYPPSNDSLNYRNQCTTATFQKPTTQNLPNLVLNEDSPVQELSAISHSSAIENSHDSPMQIPLPFTHNKQYFQSNNSFNSRNQDTPLIFRASTSQNLPTSKLIECTVSEQTLSQSSINTLPTTECSSNILVHENESDFHNSVTSSTPTLAPYICELSKIYAEILENINEYTVEKNIAFTHCVKSNIFQLLETHRPIKLDDYEYGFSKILKKDHRMIIKEAHDKSKVREYCKRKSDWRCLNYNSKNRCFALHLISLFGILFAPLKHQCETKEYSIVMQVQDFLKQGKSKDALVFVKHRSESYYRKQTLPTAMQNNNTISSKKLSVLQPSPSETSQDAAMQSSLPFTPTEQYLRSNDLLNSRNQDTPLTFPALASQNLSTSKLIECTVSKQTLSTLSTNTVPTTECIRNIQENEINFNNPVPSSTVTLTPYICELLKMYVEISEQINEYSVEDDIDFTDYTTKYEVIKLLETHRPIKLVDYEYGLSTNLKEDHLIIINELDDKSKVREFCKIKNHWRCSNYNPKNGCDAKNLIFLYGILFAPNSHTCEAKEYSFAMEVQDLLKQGKAKEAIVLVKGDSDKKQTAIHDNNGDVQEKQSKSTEAHAVVNGQSERKRALPFAEHNNYTGLITPDEMLSFLKWLSALYPLPNKKSHSVQSSLPFTPTKHYPQSNDSQIEGPPLPTAQSLPNSVPSVYTISTDEMDDSSVQELSANSQLSSNENSHDVTLLSSLSFTNSEQYPQSNGLLNYQNQCATATFQIPTTQSSPNSVPSVWTISSDEIEDSIIQEQSFISLLSPNENPHNAGTLQSPVPVTHSEQYLQSNDSFDYRNQDKPLIFRATTARNLPNSVFSECTISTDIVADSSIQEQASPNENSHDASMQSPLHVAQAEQYSQPNISLNCQIESSPLPYTHYHSVPMQSPLHFAPTEQYPQSNNSLNYHNQCATVALQVPTAQSLPKSVFSEYTIPTDKTEDNSVQECLLISHSSPNKNSHYAATLQSPLPSAQTHFHYNHLLEYQNEDASLLLQTSNTPILPNSSPNFLTQHLQQLNPIPSPQLIYQQILNLQQSGFTDYSELPDTNNSINHHAGSAFTRYSEYLAQKSKRRRFQ